MTQQRYRGANPLDQRQIAAALDRAGGIIIHAEDQGGDVVSILINRYIDEGCRAAGRAKEVRRLLALLERKHRIVIERDSAGRKFLLVATVDAYARFDATRREAERRADETATEDSRQGKRIDETTLPLREPTRLHVEACDLVKITCDTPGVAEKINETVGAVIRELRKVETERTTHRSVVALIVASAQAMYKDSRVLNGMVNWAMVQLLERQILVESPEQDEGDMTYLLQLPEQTMEDLLDETLRRCEQLAEELSRANASATAAGTRATKAERLKTDAEAALSTVQAEFAEYRTQHEDRVYALTTDHEAKVARLESELAASKKPALTTRRREQLEKLGIKVAE